MYTDLPYRIALIAIAGLHLGISRHYLRRSADGGIFTLPRAEGPLMAWGAGLFIAGYGIGVFMWLLNPGWVVWAGVSLPAGLRWSGAPCMALGAALHLWGAHHLGRNLTVTIGTRADHTLITSGPYRWVRHPLYTGGMIESLGVAVLVANGVVVLAALAFWIVVARRTAKEEAFLLDAFGEAYRDYQRCVGRFLPRWNGGEKPG